MGNNRWSVVGTGAIDESIREVQIVLYKNPDGIFRVEPQSWASD